MAGSRFQYTGQIAIPEAGLYYYKARIYSPSIGRFLQTDPLGYVDGPNLYAYVGNDPINNVDPSGLKLTCTGTGSNQVCVFTPDAPFNTNGPTFGYAGGGVDPFAGSSGLGADGSGLGLGGNEVSVDTGFAEFVMEIKTILMNSCPMVPDGPGGDAIDQNIRVGLDRVAADNQRLQGELRNLGPRGEPGYAGAAAGVVARIELERGLYFSQLVSTGGAWDYKNLPDSKGAQDFGNFNYGATALAFGFDYIDETAAHAYSLYDNGTLEGQMSVIRDGQKYFRMGCY